MTSQGDARLLAVAERALAWAKARDYAGYSKHDGLNSPWLRRLAVGGKWPRLVLIQAVMRAPLNLRPVLKVAPCRDPKGIALFARAWLDHHAVTGDPGSARDARALLDWLLESSATGFPGASWGYPYPWQDAGFFAPAGFPNRIVTFFVGRALVHGFDVLGDSRYLDAARAACEFILRAPKVLYEDERQKCLSYVPSAAMKMAVLDISPLCGSLCALVGARVGDRALVDEGRKLVAFAVDKQTEYGGFWYTHPPEDSHITHDNYHTGEIVEALREFGLATGEPVFDAAFHKGLAHYRRDLFTAELRPKWMWDREYPHDIHGYAVGVLTFTGAGDLDTARRIAAAALEEMWDEGDGRFYYQRRRRFTIRFTLMRWCQAWMSHALLALLRGAKAAAGDAHA
ncbi:MAG: hypothetical protein HY903_10005 [Deltaproteobacteria bacterium]|nr:hypothetical protein [Deltaproteobacteria bacterium]